MVRIAGEEVSRSTTLSFTRCEEALRWIASAIRRCEGLCEPISLPDKDPGTPIPYLAIEFAGALWFEKLWHIGRLEHRKLALAVVLRIALGGAEDKVGHSVARIQEELDRPRC